MCICVCENSEKERMYFYKTKHVHMIAQYVILHSQTSSCFAQGGLGGNLIKLSGLKEIMKILRQPFFLAASLETCGNSTSGSFVGGIQT